MEWTGGCLCGAVRYRASQTPDYARYCHCGMCRKVSGAPFTGYAEFPEGVFEWVAGRAQPIPIVRRVIRRFCGTCGSSLT